MGLGDIQVSSQTPAIGDLLDHASGRSVRFTLQSTSPNVSFWEQNEFSMDAF